jgi:hypothetical protein
MTMAITIIIPGATWKQILVGFQMDSFSRRLQVLSVRQGPSQAAPLFWGKRHEAIAFMSLRGAGQVPPSSTHD